MENATKALVMAGSILIALLIIGALLLMFNNLSSYQNTNQQNIKDTQIVEFNNQFTTYIRNDVRGNELYSLLNSVIDYNRRKTIEGDQGAIQIGYQPMEVKFSLQSPDGKDRKDLSIDYNNRIFKTNNYTVNKSDNTFERNIKNIIDGEVIDSTYTEAVLNSLTTGITKIFLPNTATEEAKKIATNAFNNITGLSVSYRELKEGTSIRERVYKYYEYVQFKRAHFDCVDSKYDNSTGRILYLEFKFNGTIQ